VPHKSIIDSSMEVEEVEQAEADLPFSCKIRGFQWLSEDYVSEPPELRGFHRLSEEHDNETPILRWCRLLLKAKYEATLSPRYFSMSDK
jgi:hypothetical protein